LPAAQLAEHKARDDADCGLDFGFVARAANAWAGATFRLVRIWAATDARDVRSRRGLEQLGMQPAAVRVGDHVGRAGERVDEMVSGLNRAPIDNSSPEAADTGTAHSLAQRWLEGVGI
jgi:hypothetical protein